MNTIGQTEVKDGEFGGSLLELLDPTTGDQVDNGWKETFRFL